MPPTNEIHAITYERAGEPLRRAFAQLQQRAYAEDELPPGEPIPPLHDPALAALAFYLVADGRIASYAAVVYKQIVHDGAAFAIAGLSCVATDPAYRRRGLGARVVAAATRAIEQSRCDIGLFTCDPPLAAFYAHAGGWPAAPGITLIGSRQPGALTSTAFNKLVLMRLLSPKAQAAAAQLRQATIDLDLPVGQFL